MLSVSRPEHRPVLYCRCGNQRIAQTDVMTPPILPQVIARLLRRFVADRYARKGLKKRAYQAML
jgi:hypothetical protein